jgi:hypothetical protein
VKLWAGFEAPIFPFMNGGPGKIIYNPLIFPANLPYEKDNFTKVLNFHRRFLVR